MYYKNSEVASIASQLSPYWNMLLKHVLLNTNILFLIDFFDKKKPALDFLLTTILKNEFP